MERLYPSEHCRLQLEPLLHNQVGIKCLFYPAMTMHKSLKIATAAIKWGNTKEQPAEIETVVEDNICYYLPCRYPGNMYQHPSLPSVSFNKRNKRLSFGHSQGFNPRPTVILGEAAPSPLDNPFTFEVKYQDANHLAHLIKENDWRMFMDNLPIFPVRENHYRESSDIDDVESYDVSPLSKMYRYILIDYENIQPVSLDDLQLENYKIINFVGKKQERVFMDFACAMQGMGNRAEYIKLADTGKNALDFHISCYLGKISIQSPNAKIFVLSKDKGYDPIIEHLRQTEIDVRRITDLKECESHIHKPPTPEAQKNRVNLKRQTTRHLKLLKHYHC